VKSGTLHHIKMKRLKRLLRIPLFQTAGVLVSLWSTTADNAPDGGIGKLTDEEIATEIEWEGDPTALIEALVDAGWLDRDGETLRGERCRLTIHDWKDHCPDYIKERLRKQNWRSRKREIRTYVEKTRDTPGTTTGQVRDIPGTGPASVPSLSNQGKANQSKSNQVQSNHIPPPESLECWEGGDDSQSKLDGFSHATELDPFRSPDELLRLEADFLQAWNSTSGVIRYDQPELSERRRRQLFELLRDPAWDWRRALGHFPLKHFGNGGWQPTVGKFLESADFVLNILEGRYDKPKRSNNGPIHGPGQRYDPKSISENEPTF